MPNKKKVFVAAKLLAGQDPKVSLLYVQTTSSGLLLELTEKATQKYLMMSSNDFGAMIEDLVIVTNNRLKIENLNS